jgi:hypothetical protein
MFQQMEITSKKINSQLNALLDQFEQASTNAQRMVIVNRLDEIVTSEVYYWCNVLNDIPEDCGPCMESKGELAKDQIATLMELANSINEIRLDLLDR